MVSSYTSEVSFVLKVAYELKHLLLLKGEVYAEDAKLKLTRRAKCNNNHRSYLLNTCYVSDQHTFWSEPILHSCGLSSSFFNLFLYMGKWNFTKPKRLSQEQQDSKLPELELEYRNVFLEVHVVPIKENSLKFKNSFILKNTQVTLVSHTTLVIVNSTHSTPQSLKMKHHQQWELMYTTI